MRFEPLRVALAQTNPTVGDIEHNARRIRELIEQARGEGAALVVFPELALTGYPPEDLLLKTHFLEAAEAALVELGGVGVGLTICEDIWEPGPPATTEALAGAQVIVNLSASPYRIGYGHGRERMLVQRAVDNLAVVVFVNTVGGQDELVFDGASLVVAPDGTVRHRASSFDEDLLVVDVEGDLSSADPRPEPPDQPEEVYRALVLGLRDYVRKNGFGEVVLGLSGGIDSAFVAVLAADALGHDAVLALVMPSQYTSSESIEDATEVTRRLGIRLDTIHIDDVISAYDAALARAFAGTEPGIAEENLQARTRGNLLMAMSNRFGSLVLATGNKSEYAVGYATLYGDMAGGFAVIKDVPKTLVYELCRHRNATAGTDLVPASVLEKPPSAELRPNQRDEDSLPPYDVLDPILEAYVEHERAVEEIERMGYDRATVARVAQLVDRAEYKRRQAPPGVKITGRAFGKDRRLPITQTWSG